MDFPHPRQAGRVGTQKADYFALVASATSRQATSRTISALLSAPRMDDGDMDILGSRIAYFSQPGTLKTRAVRGAFWIAATHPDIRLPNKSRLPVNLAGSTNGNFIESQSVNPELQVAKWGTEL